MINVIDICSRLTSANPNILVGIVDGIPDLTLPGFEVLEVESTLKVPGYDAPDAHGTEICSVLFSREHGLAVGASGLVLPIFFGRPNDEANPPRASQLDIARALTMAVERGVDIVNVSAGQLSATPEAGRHLEDALELCYRRGTLVVAAAGNDGCDCLHVPAAVSTVLAVGAMDNDTRPLERSNFGASYAKNGILAPGVDVPVTTLGGKRVTRTGTSYATAIVSSVAARLLATARQAGYSLDAHDIRTVLIETASPCDSAVDGDCARFLAGKLNVPAAIKRLHQRGKPTKVAAPTDYGLQSQSIEAIMQNVSELPSALSPSTMPVTHASTARPSACSCGCNDKKSDCACGEQRANEEISSMAWQAAAPPPTLATQVERATVLQQACGCGGGKEPQKVYAIGTIWFDFGSAARYDAIVQQIGDPVAANDPAKLFAFLSDNIPFATGITFILMQDQIPVYALLPSGPFATEIYKEFIDAMQSSLDATGDLQRVAVPGLMQGSTRLMNGMILPILYPDIRGMVKWRALELVNAAKVALGDDSVDEGSIFNFLVRVYDELRNLGISSEERAINFAATNAYQAATVFSDGLRRKLELYRLAVKKSPICRPDSECWDVQLVMFDPENDRRAGRFYRFTIDVSEIFPVTIGQMRSWSAPLASI